MKLRHELVWTSVVLLLLAYGFYAAFTEAWPIGWINLAQQSVFGAYSIKGSFLIFICGALLLAALLADVFARVTAHRTSATYQPGTPLPMRAKLGSQAKLLLQVGIGFVAVLWIGGFVASAWFDQRQSADNSAVYRALSLDDGADFTAAEGDHLAVRGNVLTDRTVAHRTGSGSSGRDEYWLLPLVPSNWRAGQPVRLIVKVDYVAQLTGLAAGASVERQPLLARVGTALPVTAVSQFDKIGVLLAPGHRVLHVIASSDGKPIRQPTDYFQRMIWICGVGTVLMLVLFASSAWVVHRRERR
jgi:hypothetical protein